MPHAYSPKLQPLHPEQYRSAAALYGSTKVWDSPKYGHLSGGPSHKDNSILESILGSLWETISFNGDRSILNF